MSVVMMAAPVAELLGYRETAALLGLCERSIIRLAKVDPTFPPKLVFGGRVRFRRAELLDWIADRVPASAA